ncbi:DUF5522 domain-containing protein [Lacipirellula sp.]|uniref:DUF5522 domain-containing protein n=1 Tax=Lacipirellula sp. TaxID=2691419 RepID=UPI003D0DA633
MTAPPAAAASSSPLVAGRDFYFERGRFVLTAEYLLRRGTCCGNGCRHCPYRKASKRLSKPPAPPVDVANTEPTSTSSTGRAGGF